MYAALGPNPVAGIIRTKSLGPGRHHRCSHLPTGGWYTCDPKLAGLYHHPNIWWLPVGFEIIPDDTKPYSKVYAR